MLFIVGPTAVGKNLLALGLALSFDGEIVNADSRQIYRFMEIGTAKPSVTDQALVPHHLIDILEPDARFSLALFLELAHQAIQDIQARGKLPIVVGGTGQYIRAILEGWQVPRVPPDGQLRQELEEEAKRDGAESLHRRLHQLDPEAASKIDPRNLRRVIRALEVFQVTGKPPSTVRHKHPTPYSPLIVGLTMSRQALYRRIDQRVEEMLETGLVEEVRGLLKLGYSPESPGLSTMGYKEITRHLRGELILEEASQRIKYETHRFARHQYAWFRLPDPRINWLQAGSEASGQAGGLVSEFLRRGDGYDKIASAQPTRVSDEIHQDARSR